MIERSDEFARDETMNEGYMWAGSGDIEKEIAGSIEKAEARMRLIIDEFKEREEALVSFL